MNKPTKIFLILIGIVSIGVGISSYISEKDPFDTYFAIGIGVALIFTVISIKPENKPN
ncbi:hypothetical protein RM549_08895 [Salegentibacter sp. F188]|uniref:Uncharacterized protein n=1 Tax=Autumnicola patrickiae TaxID=3075591 RepID=A0ABU3E1P7_9FLAO|nr:hypothetical protein [Salegentibacter sp. F188]MDT0689901.1 hypothetical protein [Salegentibacter sp. F188]